MQIIRKYLGGTHYVKIENALCTVDPKKLSDGAFRLYALLGSLKPGTGVSDETLMNYLNKSKRSVIKYKKELKQLDLIYTSKVQNNIYFIYIGTLTMKASKVKQRWVIDNLENKDKKEGK